MPNEALITQIENLLAEIVELGGDNERSQIVPNLTVQDASPTNLDGWLIVSDDRDGDNILARKVGSVVYSNNDLVNVMFLRGTEPIAFQQGSESSNNGIWEIVPSTSTDIFYDKGDVGIGNSSPTTPLDVTGTVTITDDVLHAGDTDTKMSFATDDIEFTAGGLSMLKLTETTQDVIRLGPGSGDVDINFNGDMFLLGSSGSFGVGTTAPDTIASGSSTGTTLNVRDGTNAAELALQGAIGGAKLNMVDIDGAADVKWMQYFTDGGFTKYRALTDVGGLKTNNIFIMQHSNGNSAFGNFPTTAKLLVDQLSSSAAIPVLLLDQADVDEPFIKYRGTAAAATLTRSIVAETDVTTATRQGFVKIEIDDTGNQVTDGDYYVAFYSLA